MCGFFNKAFLLKAIIVIIMLKFEFYFIKRWILIELNTKQSVHILRKRQDKNYPNKLGAEYEEPGRLH